MITRIIYSAHTQIANSANRSYRCARSKIYYTRFVILYTSQSTIWKLIFTNWPYTDIYIKRKAYLRFVGIEFCLSSTYTHTHINAYLYIVHETNLLYDVLTIFSAPIGRRTSTTDIRTDYFMRFSEDRARDVNLWRSRKWRTRRARVDQINTHGALYVREMRGR